MKRARKNLNFAAAIQIETICVVAFALPLAWAVWADAQEVDPTSGLPIAAPPATAEGGLPPAEPGPGTAQKTPEQIQQRLRELQQEQHRLIQEIQAASGGVQPNPATPGASPRFPSSIQPGGLGPEGAGLVGRPSYTPLPMAPGGPVGDAEKQQLRSQLDVARSQLMEMAASMERAKAATPLPADATLRAFPLKYVRPEEIAQVLHNITGGGGPRIAIDDRTKALLLAGNEKQLSVAEQLVQTLDQPGKGQPAKAAETLQLRIVWLLDGLADTEGKTPNEPIVSPQVLDALNKLGFDATRVVCQQVTTLTLGPDSRGGGFHFEVPVLINGQGWQFVGQGKITPMVDERYSVEFDLNVRQPNNPENSNLGGSIYTPLGHYTVMGTTTFVAMNSEAKPPAQAPVQDQHLSAFVVYLDKAPVYPARDSEKVKSKEKR